MHLLRLNAGLLPVVGVAPVALLTFEIAETHARLAQCQSCRRSGMRSKSTSQRAPRTCPNLVLRAPETKAMPSSILAGSHRSSQP